MVLDLLSESGLSFERLQSFCRVAEAGGVSRAAKGDATKQSLYSRQVKELEEFFGAELIRRRGRGIVLTAAGERLHSLAREQFSSLTDFKAECQGRPLELVVGAGESLIQWLLLPALAKFQRELPNARFKFLNLTGDEIIRRLNDGLVDFGVVRRDAVGRPLKSSHLGSMGFSLFVPTQLQPKSRDDNLSSLLEKIPLAALEGDGVFRQQLAAIAKNKRLNVRIVVECSSFTLVARALASGRVGGILPTIAKSELERKAGSFFSTPIPAFNRELSLVWNPRQLRVRPALENASRILQDFAFDGLKVES